MSLATRLSSSVLALLGAFALAGCTAGTVERSDGSSMNPSEFDGTKIWVTFDPVSDTTACGNGSCYQAPVTMGQNPYYPNVPTFSIDPTTARTGSYNVDSSIPGGDYKVSLERINGAGWLDANYTSQTVHHSYAGTCKDTYSGQSTPCELYKIVLYYGTNPAYCPQPTYAGDQVTVPVCTLGGSYL